MNKVGEKVILFDQLLFVVLCFLYIFNVIKSKNVFFVIMLIYFLILNIIMYRLNKKEIKRIKYILVPIDIFIFLIMIII